MRQEAEPTAGSPKESGGGRLRQLRGVTGTVVRIVAILLPLYVVSFLLDLLGILGIWFEKGAFLASFLAIMLALTFLLVPGRKGEPRDRLPRYDAALAILALAGAGYMALFFSDVRWREGNPSATDIVFGIMTIVLLLEGTRRLVGWPFLVIVMAFLFYARFTFLFPGLLEGKGYSLTRMVGTLYIQQQGVFGLPTDIAATTIIVYILFGQLLVAGGAGEWLIDLARCLGGKFRGGPAKIAVIASALLGTVTGSPAANVVTTGVFTIPLMKKTGYKAHFAGAVEAVASTGGAILPPVMGVTAFIMAEFLDVPYAKVAIAAALPAILYYLAVFVQVDLAAAKSGMRGLPPEELPPLRATFARGWHYLLPIAILIYFLLIRGYSANISGLYASGAMLLVSLFRKKTRIGTRRLVQGLEGTTYGTLLIAVTCAVSGLIIGSVSLTGVGFKLSYLLVEASSGSTLLLLALTALTATVLGMGLPVTPAYITLVILIVPALSGLGVLPIASHLFIYYFAVLSFITPPVCPAVYVAAGLAGSDMMRTGLQAVRLGIVAYIVPFMFIYSPPLLLEGPVAGVLLAVVTSIIGVTALCFGIEGYALRRVNWIQRIAFLAGGVLLMIPGWRTDTAGAGLVIVPLLWQWMSLRTARLKLTPAR